MENKYLLNGNEITKEEALKALNDGFIYVDAKWIGNTLHINKVQTRSPSKKEEFFLDRKYGA